MERKLPLLVAMALLAQLALAGQAGREKLDSIEQSLKDDVPRVYCVDERIATGGQPKDGAYGKLAASGYRSVLTLRTSTENVDLKREQELAEKAGLKYINIPFVTANPDPELVPRFIKAVKDQKNQPMLINCGSANRVGALWMIYRVIDQGWSEEKALEEAEKIGLTSPGLKSFAQQYIATHKANKQGSL
ncbi:MAG TPA: protein tyrosine phosphatase family protein [Blastocatellia bacterium]|jgi:uncharacterized protein (TIGR01244 family)